MIYGFNEKKEKVRFVLIEETVTINQSGFAYVADTAKLKSKYGIDDVTKFALIGASCSDSFNPHYFMIPNIVYEKDETADVGIGRVKPYIYFDRRNAAQYFGIIIHNNEAVGLSYNVYVLLMEIA
jgi:hypothetical protein